MTILLAIFLAFGAGNYYGHYETAMEVSPTAIECAERGKDRLDRYAKQHDIGLLDRDEYHSLVSAHDAATRSCFYLISVQAKAF